MVTKRNKKKPGNKKQLFPLPVSRPLIEIELRKGGRETEPAGQLITRCDVHLSLTCASRRYWVMRIEDGNNSVAK